MKTPNPRLQHNRGMVTPSSDSAQRLHRFARLGTIDLRVDYPRPGIGEHFDLRAEVLRLGSRVANTRMEFSARTASSCLPARRLTSCPETSQNESPRL